MSISKIEWTEKTWNPLSGCTKISPGCLNCYAERMAKRLQAMGNYNYRNGFKLTLHRDVLPLPLSWKKPCVVFVNSMSDLFHEDVPDSFIQDTFQIMAQAKQHTFQVLTKRSTRLAELSTNIYWPPNVWMGVSIENSAYSYRLENLAKTKAVIKFISFEPLLGPIKKVDLKLTDWVIVGGESGPHARPMNKQWVFDIRDQCNKTNTPFFFKQWGGTNKKAAGRTLDGKIWGEMPTANLALAT